MKRFATVVLAVAVSSPAFALDEPYMWGVGPRVGTMVLPGSFPAAFPNKVTNYDFDKDGKRDKDAQGNPLNTSLARVKGDVSLGFDAVMYLDHTGRVGALGTIAFGQRFSDLSFALKYDRVLDEGTVDILAGGAVGVGQWKFTGDIGAEQLKVPYYPLRAHLTGQLRDGPRAYYLTTYGQFGIPGNHYYVDQAGNEKDVSAPLNYFSAGIEIGAFFGDFTPPKKRKSKGKKKKG